MSTDCKSALSGTFEVVKFTPTGNPYQGFKTINVKNESYDYYKKN